MALESGRISSIGPNAAGTASGDTAANAEGPGPTGGTGLRTGDTSGATDDEGCLREGCMTPEESAECTLPFAISAGDQRFRCQLRQRGVIA